MNDTQTPRRRRQDILRQMGNIDSMRRATINKQYFPVVRQGTKTKKQRGPYYVL